MQIFFFFFLSVIIMLTGVWEFSLSLEQWLQGSLAIYRPKWQNVTLHVLTVTGELSFQCTLPERHVMM